MNKLPNISKNIFCPITHTRKFKKIFSIKKFPIFMGVSNSRANYEFLNLNWWINEVSGNVQIHPKVPLEKLYFKPHGSGTVGKTWKDHHDLFFKLVCRYLNGNICEIGGGQNSVLNRINSFSKIKKFYCFDKNLKLNKKIKKIKKIKKFFNKDYFKNKFISIDLLIHSHTFEHLYDPDKFLKDVRSILSKNGKHIFTMPNMEPMIMKGYSNAMNFEHPFYYDEKLVDNLLIKNNFKIVKKIFFKEDHSIMYVTKKTNSVKKKINVSKNYNYLEYKKNLKLFKSMFSFWKKEIFKINRLIKKSEHVYIFGAHIFSQMMIFNGLNKKKIVGILDNDKLKIGKYLYGTNFKIFEPSILKNIKNSCIILKAGSYNEEIKKQILKINPNIKII